MMPPYIPEHPTAGDLFALHCWMIDKDPEHRENIKAEVGHEPTHTELAEHWYSNGAEEFERTVLDLVAKNSS